MRFWDVGKPVAPRKWRKQIVSEVSSSAEEESCTPEYNNLADISTIVAKCLRFAGDFATIFIET